MVTRLQKRLCYGMTSLVILSVFVATRMRPTYQGGGVVHIQRGSQYELTTEWKNVNSTIKKSVLHEKTEMSNFFRRYEPEKGRQNALRKVAEELGVPDIEGFVEGCRAYSPLNLCAEIALMKGIWPNTTCPQGRACPGEIVKWGAGSELVQSPDHGPILVENGVFLLPVNHSEEMENGKPVHHGRYPGQKDIVDPQFSKDGDAIVPNDLKAYIPMSYDIFFEGAATDAKISAAENDPPKIILWHSGPRYAPKIDGLEPLPACPEFPCLMTSNRTYTNASSALLFNSAFNVPARPIQRRPDQIFVYHNQEPPYLFDHVIFNGFNKEEWRDVFNWTMTYRHDSDIISPFAILRRKRGGIGSDQTQTGSVFKGDDFKNYTAIWNNKTKMVAAMISNCHAPSNRDEYIKELQRYFQVDVFGKCGNLKCPRGEDEKCLEIISNEYKFFLGFENAFCEDYVTEKLFRYLKGDFVLVVRGSNQYITHAPGDILVNTADYPNPQMLAERLTQLASNPREYIDILKAKDSLVVVDEDFIIPDGVGGIKHIHYHYENVPFCQMCQKLWNLEKHAKTIPDIKKWFDEKLCLSKLQVKDVSQERGV